MSQLSIIAPDLTDACAIYRVNPYEKLGIETESFSGKIGFQLHRAVMNAPMCLLQRPWTSQHVSIAHTIKDCGKKLILDFDDLLSELPIYNPNAHHFKDCLPNLKALCSLADGVTVASKYLAECAEQWGAKKVVYVPNAIDDSLKGIYRAPERKKSLLWRGSSTHHGDVESGKQTFFDFAAKGYEIIFFGDRPSWGYQLDHKHYGVVDYVNFLSSMARLAPEYVFVPLVDNNFNHAKSDCAASEAYLIGAKLIHSNIGEFKGLPEVGEPRWLSDVNHKRMELINSL